MLNRKSDVDPIMLDEFIGEIKFFPTNNDKGNIGYTNQRIQDIGYLKEVTPRNENVDIIGLNVSVNGIGTKIIDGKRKYIKPDMDFINMLESVD